MLCIVGVTYGLHGGDFCRDPGGLADGDGYGECAKECGSDQDQGVEGYLSFRLDRAGRYDGWHDPLSDKKAGQDAQGDPQDRQPDGLMAQDLFHLPSGGAHGL